MLKINASFKNIKLNMEQITKPQQVTWIELLKLFIDYNKKNAQFKILEFEPIFNKLKSLIYNL